MHYRNFRGQTRRRSSGSPKSWPGAETSRVRSRPIVKRSSSSRIGPIPYRGLGQVLLDHHDYAEAAEALQSSIRLGRDDHQAFYWLGRACMGKGELSAADAALVRATQLNPDDAESFADLGLVRMAQGDIAGADQAVTRAISLKPDLAEAHRLSELFARGHDPDAAMKAARSILHDLFERE